MRRWENSMVPDDGDVHATSKPSAAWVTTGSLAVMASDERVEVAVVLVVAHLHDPHVVGAALGDEVVGLQHVRVPARPGRWP
jgi:hypothetical protein